MAAMREPLALVFKSEEAMEETAKLVEVALVVVEFPLAIKSPFWLITNLVVEATFKSKRLPEKPVIESTAITVPLVPPTTESLA